MSSDARLKIQDGVVVEGQGTLVTDRSVLAAAELDVVLPTLPGLGLLRADCSFGKATTRFANTSGRPLDVQAWVVDKAAAYPDVARVVRFRSLAGGVDTARIGSPSGGVATQEWQVSYTDRSGRDHVATMWSTAGASGNDCVIASQGLTTG